MLFHIPPDDLNDIGQNEQQVFCWLAKNSLGIKSETDESCKHVESILSQSICARISVENNDDLLKNLKLNMSDIFFTQKWRHFMASLKSYQKYHC